MLVFCCAVKVFIFSRFLMAIFFNYYTLFEGLGQDCFLRIYHRGTYSQRSRLAPFLRALQISRYPHDHSRFVCYSQSFFAKLHKSHKSCKAHKPRVFRGFVVSWFRGFAESVLRHPFYERHLRDLMKRFCLAAVNFSLNIDRSLLI